jgi:RNA polymerase sigma factor (sigma-70 family)
LKKEGSRSAGAGADGAEAPLHLLARAAQRNDGAAREQFALCARDRVARAVREQLSDRLAREAGFEDVVQDVLLRIERDLPRFKVRSERSIHQWIITLVGNRIRDLFDYYERAKKRDWTRRISLSELRREEQDGDQSDELTTGSAPLSDVASDRDLFARAMVALQKLPDDEAHAVRRVELDGESIASVGRELGLGESTVRMRLSRGLARIAQLIGEEFRERGRPGAPA